MNSGPTASWETTTRTHSCHSPLVQGDVSVGGKSSTDQRAALTNCCFLRFAEIELISALSVIILHYKITVLDEPQFAHETAEERKQRVLAPQAQIVLKPIRTPLVFTPREGENSLGY